MENRRIINVIMIILKLSSTSAFCIQLLSSIIGHNKNDILRDLDN